MNVEIRPLSFFYINLFFFAVYTQQYRKKSISAALYRSPRCCMQGWGPVIQSSSAYLQMGVALHRNARAITGQEI
jgi:hypothetical protein